MDCFLSEEVSDITLVVEGTPIPALKAHLISKSNVFRAMFSGNFKESNEESVEIKDTTIEAFKRFLQFLHFNHLFFKDDKDLHLVEEVRKLSDRYEVSPLLTAIDDYLKNTEVSFDNMEVISKIAVTFEITELKTNVMTFIDNNLNHFVDKDSHLMNDTTNGLFLEVLANNYRQIIIDLEDVVNKTVHSDGVKCFKKCACGKIGVAYLKTPYSITMLYCRYCRVHIIFHD